MAMDGISVAALTLELNNELSQSRIDKIQQTENDELLISFYGGSLGAKKLRLTANPQVARASLTFDKKKSPDTAPLFCMLLRKHLSGARFKEAVQPDFERIIKLVFLSKNDFGEPCEKCLIAELMGRHSNIILVDETGKIVDSIKHIDFSQSSVRQVLPGLLYEYPPKQGKADILSVSLNEIVDILSAQEKAQKADKALVNAFLGISPLIAREITYSAFKTCDIYLEELDYSAILDLSSACFELFKRVRKKDFSPCYLVRRDTDKPFEFSAIPINQYQESTEVVFKETMSEAAENFYKERDARERMARKSAHLVKMVSNNLERCAKKLIIQTTELKNAENMDKYKRYAELITANLYALEKGEKNCCVVDYFDPEMKEVTITLDERLSPSENAQRYFKKYNKAKIAKEELKKQIEIASEEQSYLESVEEELRIAETEEDLSEIADELYEQGYLKRHAKAGKRRKEISKPLEFKTKDGFTVLVGKNNKQNDLLTQKTAKNSDMWLHTKDIHGSHVILRYEYGKEFTIDAIIEAAKYAAKYSKASGSANVPVDYTLVKYVKKPSGSPPGKVIYTNNETVNVKPFD